ncbi:phospholipase D family protein [Geodermatophilus sp. SYSU D00663]
MSRIVTGTDVWPAITAVLKTRKRKLVAVAFLGSDAPDLLATLGRDDLLVCDASLRALKSGATSPDALQVFLERGVRVRSHPRLHAKIYVGGDAAFVGSANASASAVRQAEAGIIATEAAQVRELRAFVRGLTADSDSTLVDEDYVVWAKTKFRPPRPDGAAGRAARATDRLFLYSYGDPEPPSVTRAAERQRRARGEDLEQAAGTVGYSWGPEGAWRPGARCVWVARGDEGDEDRWVAEPPALCFDAAPVGGSSKQWVFWWRTPAASGRSWAELRREVLVRTGRRLEMGSSTAVADVVNAVFQIFEVDKGTAGMLDEA